LDAHNTPRCRPARVKALLVQAQWKRPNQRFPQGQARHRQKSSRNLPQSHAWRNHGRRGITALSPVSVQSPLLSRPINRSHHERIACTFASFAFLSGPTASGEDPHHHRLRPGRPGQGGGADWTVRRAGAQTAITVRDDARARPREHRRLPLPLREIERRICRRADSSRRL
jgi:hypothetical protein